jgi:hypothetical protein
MTERVATKSRIYHSIIDRAEATFFPQSPSSRPKHRAAMRSGETPAFALLAPLKAEHPNGP